MLSGGFRNFSQGVTQSNKQKNLYIDDNLGIFPRVLHNLIKRKIHILMTITKKKTRKLIKFYNIKLVEFSCGCC